MKDVSLRSLSVLGFPLYAIDSEGNIWSHKTKKFLVPVKDKYGYFRIHIVDETGKPRTLLIHRLVAKMFLPTQEPSLQIDHIDGNKQNNKVSNLRWVSNRENAHYAMKNGLMPHAVFMFEDVVRRICVDLANGISVAEISKKTGFSYHAITAIRLKRNWTHISKDFVFPSTKKQNYPDEKMIHRLCQLIVAGKSDKEIMNTLGIRKETVYRTRKGKIHKRIMMKYSMVKNVCQSTREG